MGGPTTEEYEALQAERDALGKELDHAKRTIEQLQAKVRCCMYIYVHVHG